VDILREQNHSHRNYDQELQELKESLSKLETSRLEDWTAQPRRNSDTADLGRQCQNRTFLSIESESCLLSASLDQLDRMEVCKSAEDLTHQNKMDDSITSEKNCNLDETTVVSVKLAQDECEDEQSFESLKTVVASSNSSSKVEVNHSQIVYAMEQSQFINKMSKTESRLVESCSTQSFSSLTSPEVDSGLETTTSENTPFASRPESELVLPDDTRLEDEVEPTPRQLEMLLEESGASGDSSPRDSVSPEKTGSNTNHFINDINIQNGGGHAQKGDLPIQNGELPIQNGDHPILNGIHPMQMDANSIQNDDETKLGEQGIDESSYDVQEEITKIEAKLQENEDEISQSGEESVSNSENENHTNHEDEDKNARPSGANDEMFEEMENKPLVRRKRSNDIEETHRSVEEIISEIQDPNLDCSMDDIQAMVNETDLNPEKEKLLPPSPDQQRRVSPEFTRAAGLITKNPDPLFDPEDPAVKELEEWELKSQHEKSINIEDKSGSKILGIFKNKSKRNSKIEERPLMESEKDQDKDQDKDINWGCINSWLIRILIKIFD